MSSTRPSKEANRITNLWRRFGPNTYPIDIGSVVDEIVNPTLESEELSLVYHSFDTFDGMMKHAGGGKWAAIVNDSIPYFGRRNFTAAHELFHFLGHREKVQDFECSRRDINDFERERLEVEANQFASQLLLPPDTIREKAKEDFNYDTVKTLSDELGASVSAIAYKWLSLCPKKKKLGFFISRDGFVDQGYASSSAYASGLFFKSGQELPNGCLTGKVHSGHEPGQAEISHGVWLENSGAKEVVHQTHFEGFTYSFVTLDH